MTAPLSPPLPARRDTALEAPAPRSVGTRPSGGVTESRLAGILCCLFASVVWGTTGTAATFAPGVPSLAIGAAAMGIGGLLQALIALPSLRAHARGLWAARACLLPAALAIALYPLAFYAGMRLAGVTAGTVIAIGAAPIVSALIERVFDGARLGRSWAIGAGLGIAGMVLLSLAKGHGASGSNLPLGAALALVASATYALYAWAARRMMQRGLPSRAVMGAAFGLGGLLLMPVLWLSGAAFLESGQNLATGLYMALVPMFLGYIAFGRALAALPASLATTLTLFEPVVAALLAIVVVGERLAPQGWLGVGLVIACLAWSSWPRRT